MGKPAEGMHVPILDRGGNYLGNNLVVIADVRRPEVDQDVDDEHDVH